MADDRPDLSTRRRAPRPAPDEHTDPVAPDYAQQHPTRPAPTPRRRPAIQVGTRLHPDVVARLDELVQHSGTTIRAVLEAAIDAEYGRTFGQGPR